MSNVKTGFWSAIGALAGGVAGAYAGKFAVQQRPRYRYATESRFSPVPSRRGPGGTEIEDAMVIGGSAGAVIGAFIGGAASAPADSPEPPPQLAK